MSEAGAGEPEPGLDLEGSAAYPRRNGQPEFAAPWQSRAFGMAMALHQSGAIDWEEFREKLVQRIAAAERATEGELASDEDGFLYYERWMGALTELLIERGVLDASELGARAAEFRAGARREVY
jgi:nitrile hydratase accessory protein